MHISTKGRYALRMLLDLAEHRESGFIALKDIAARQDISKKYLEQIIPMLTKGSVLRASRGTAGGYMLAHAPDTITVGEVLRLTEGSLSPVACAGENPIECTRCADCPTLPVWQGLARVINEYLDDITLQDILDQQHAKVSNDYVI